ncbi:MAG TPA: thioredoxin, partial [Oxalobacteraceae bacterium]|nr:thioredoxin [Oxalobacteraceae bacterium]
MNSLPDGLIVIAKRECPTCVLVEPLLRELAQGATPLTVYVQDDPDYAAGVPNVIDDRSLEHSYRLNIEIVPTLIRVEGGREVERTYGWHRGDWQRISGRDDLGLDLPALRPGCGSKTLDPGVAEELAVRFGDVSFASRSVEIAGSEDVMEACFERGWT